MLLKIVVLVGGLILFELNRRYLRRFPAAPLRRQTRVAMWATLGAALLAVAWFTVSLVSTFGEVSSAPPETKARTLELGIASALLLPGILILLCIATQLVLYVMWKRYALQADAADQVAPT
jgi:hypothetical protein